jgi:hypothetical protein
LAARLLPHPLNFVPIAAIALFAGYLFGNRLSSIAIPLSAMIVGDLLIGTYDYRVMLVVYASLSLPIAMSGLLRGGIGPQRLLGVVVASSLLFFVATNFAVWYFGSLYTHDASGLFECYIAAIPFFKFTLLGDLMWTAVLFGGYALSRVGLKSFELTPAAR